MIDVDSKKAIKVRKLFELYSKGDQTLYSLVNWCKDNGLKGNREKNISVSNMHKILQNIFYIGLMKFKSEIFEGKHKPIISKKLFDKCQEVLNKRGKVQEVRKHYFAFLGLMKCKSCGCSITGERQKGHNYYRCTKKKGACQEKHYLREENLVEQIKDFLEKVSLTSQDKDKVLFELEKEEVVGINLENLKAVLRRTKIGSSLTIEKVENTLKLGIHDRVKRDFSLALIDIDAEEKEMPKWEFKSVIKMDAESFVEAIEDCLVVSDACTFIAEPAKFIIEATGLNSARAEFSADELEIYSDNSIASFSLEYLNKFIKGAKISSRAVISFSDNHPMRIDFPTGNVMLSFVLAPRIEQED